MSLRRQEKINRVIREVVSDIIQNRLNDPRITGLVSITEVDISPDLRNAQILLSIMAEDEKAARKTFMAIKHATSHIRSLLGDKLSLRFLPIITFQEDKKLKKTLETLKIIEQASAELRLKDEQRADDANQTSIGSQEDERQ